MRFLTTVSIRFIVVVVLLLGVTQVFGDAQASTEVFPGDVEVRGNLEVGDLGVLRETSQFGDFIIFRDLSDSDWWGMAMDIPNNNVSFAGGTACNPSRNCRVGIGTNEPQSRLDVRGNVRIEGTLRVTGTKNFVQAHPKDATKDIVYVALEGGEAGTYFRGSAELVDGTAVIKLPEHFALITNLEGLTVQLTPLGDFLQLYLVEKTPNQLVVREATGKTGTFDFLVQGVRTGFENHQPIQPKS